MPGEARHEDWIRLRGLELDCVVGVYPRERDVPQPLRVELELALDTEPAARSERLSQTVHYGEIIEQVHFLLKSCRFRMLETAAHALCRYLLAPPALGERRAQIARVRLSLEKPTALGGTVVPRLTVERDAAWVGEIVKEHKPFGVVDVIHETRDAGIYRLNIAPGQSIPLHEHRVMQEAEMVLTRGLLRQGKRARVGSIERWPHRLPHRYDNPTTRYQTILCVDCPPFTEADELPVAAPGGEALGGG